MSVPAAEPKALLAPSANPRPAIPYSKTLTGPLFEPKESMLERLAKIAAPQKVQPVPGWVGIQRATEPNVHIPPECMLYENDYFKFQLGKMPKYRDYPHDESATKSVDGGVKDLTKGVAALDVSASAAFKEAQELAVEQKEVKTATTPAPAPKVPVSGQVKGFRKSKDGSAPVGKPAK